MSLDKAIEHGKEHRKPYQGSKRFDTSCRPHGSCSWCESDRLKYRKVFEIETKEQLAEIKKEGVGFDTDPDSPAGKES